MKKIFLLIILIIYTDSSRGQPEQVALDFFAKKILPKDPFYRKHILRYDGIIQLKYCDYQKYARSIVLSYYNGKDADYYYSGSNSDSIKSLVIHSIITSVSTYVFTPITSDSIKLHIPEGIRKKKKLKPKIRPENRFRIFLLRRILDPISQDKYNISIFPSVFFDNHYYIYLNVLLKNDQDVGTDYIFKISEDMGSIDWYMHIRA